MSNYHRMQDNPALIRSMSALQYLLSSLQALAVNVAYPIREVPE